MSDCRRIADGHRYVFAVLRETWLAILTSGRVNGEGSARVINPGQRAISYASAAGTQRHEGTVSRDVISNISARSLPDVFRDRESASNYLKACHVKSYRK